MTNTTYHWEAAMTAWLKHEHITPTPDQFDLIAEAYQQGWETGVEVGYNAHEEN